MSPPSFLQRGASICHAFKPAMQGITNVIFVTALDRRVLLRQYAVALKKSGTKARPALGRCDQFR